MVDYTHLIFLRNEEKRKMRDDSGYQTQVHDDLANAIDNVGANLKRTLRYIVGIDYEGSVGDLQDKLKEEGFGPERIRVCLSDTLPIVDENMFRIPGPCGDNANKQPKIK